MAETRELTLNEKRTLICALAAERTNAYEKAVELHDRSTEMENAGESGYISLDNEAEQYELLADVTDTLVELICEGRVVIKQREGEK